MTRNSVLALALVLALGCATHTPVVTAQQISADPEAARTATVQTAPEFLALHRLARAHPAGNVILVGWVRITPTTGQADIKWWQEEAADAITNAQAASVLAQRICDGPIVPNSKRTDDGPGFKIVLAQCFGESKYPFVIVKGEV